MWWSKALLLAAVLALGPAGCGFRPMYGSMGGRDSVADADLARIRIEPIKDRMGQLLRNGLLARLTPRGEAADYAYTLRILLSENVSNLGYRKDANATLASLTITAQIQLNGEGSTGILSDSATSIVYFDHLGPRYASVATERDAEERALNQLADDIRNRVTAAIQRYRANPNDERYRRRSTLGESPR